MSLGKAKTRIKEGVKELQSVEGLKHTASWLGLGIAIGAIIQLVLEYIWFNVVGTELSTQWRINGVSIYPNINPDYITGDQVILIVLTVALLFTKKLWLTVGFLIGWYTSGLMGLYSALGLPKPTT